MYNVKNRGKHDLQIYRFQNKRHKLLNCLMNRYTVGEYESRSLLTSCYKERAQSNHMTCAKWMILWGHHQTKNLIHIPPLWFTNNLLIHLHLIFLIKTKALCCTKMKASVHCSSDSLWFQATGDLLQGKNDKSTSLNFVNIHLWP